MPAPPLVPVYRQLPRLLRDPLAVLAGVARRYPGDLVRLDLGPVRPYLVTHPDHVQHVLREHPDRYRREGMMWQPMRRLEGDGIAGEGPRWQASRRLLQPMLTTRAVRDLTGALAGSVDAAVADLVDRAGGGPPVDAERALVRITHRAMCRAFFGDRISATTADTLAAQIAVAFRALGPRILAPFVPDRVPMPGDRRFHRAVRAVDAIILPLIAEARRSGAPRTDLVSLLIQARDEQGRALPDRWVRDDLVAMFVAGTETTATELTWLLALLHQHPPVAAAVTAEVRAAVGRGPVRAEHLPALRYTGQVVQESMRLYPVGWLFTRRLARSDTLAGADLPAGATVLLSPYLTHRLADLWPDPERFDPDRFAEPVTRRHRYAYFPFGGGPHQCLGNHFFTVEARFAVAALLARAELTVLAPGPVRPGNTITLRPRYPVRLRLTPR